MDSANETRIGTFHKPNRTGRAWYVQVFGAEPTPNEAIRVMKKDGSVAPVEVYNPVPHNGGWLCKFRHTGEAPKPEGTVIIDAAGLMGDAASETREAAQQAVSVDVEGALRVAREALARDAKALTEGIAALVEQRVKEALAKVTARVEYVKEDGTVVDCGRQHMTFARLLKLVSLGLNVWIPGPAGSGKTSAAGKVAEALGLKFWHQGKVLMEHSLLGYMDAQGRYVSTIFRVAYEFGGVFLADECDGSEAKALLVLNMALEQGEMAFPDGIVKRHADFHCIAAANTFGQGGDSDYVGRNRLDGAFLDRFFMLPWLYDEAFESELSGNPAWASRVQAFRRAAKAKGIKVLITPRASIVGARLLAAAIPQVEVEAGLIRKGMTDEQWLSLTREVGGY